MTESDFTLLILAVLAGGLALLPATLTWKNLRLFQRSPDTHASDPVSILVPVRNEAAVLDGFIVNVLASQDVDFELVVLNDASTDSSAHIISEWSQRDSRVRLIHGKPLPNGWCGKQHACHQLAEAAHNNILVFITDGFRFGVLWIMMQTPMTIMQLCLVAYNDWCGYPAPLFPTCPSRGPHWGGEV